MDLYFIRHAEPDYTIKDDMVRCLTKYGLEQANSLVSIFHSLKITRIYSSPYLRSIQTVLPIATDHALKVEIDDCFKERKSAGYTVPPDRFKGFARRQWNDHTFHYSGGESIVMTAQRYNTGIQAILRDHHNNDTVIVGCHITGLCSYLSLYGIINNYDDFLRVSPNKPWIVRCKYDGMTLINVESIRDDIHFHEKMLYHRR